MSIADRIRSLAGSLPAGLGKKARQLVDAMPPARLEALLGEVRAAARAAEDAQERQKAVDRLLRRIAASVGVELSWLELKLLRRVVIKLVLRS